MSALSPNPSSIEGRGIRTTVPAPVRLPLKGERLAERALASILLSSACLAPRGPAAAEPLSAPEVH